LAGERQARMVSAALRHPIRVRALEAMNHRGVGDLGREISATTFIHQGLGREISELKGKSQAKQVTDVSYHLKKLEEAGAIFETRAVPRRGGTERFYRANAVAYFSDQEWAATPLGRRREISRVIAQGLVVQIEGAIIADTFDSRDDRWILYEPMRLDTQGWEELRDSNAAHYVEVQRIKSESERRIEDEGTDADAIQTTFCLASFESPDPPEPTDTESDITSDGGHLDT
jgi:DNA-binding transcriptional ArsR family regulator